MPECNSKPPALTIAAALIQKDGKYLIGQRPQGKPQGGYWEFAGGKLEPGETPSQALVRECREELNVLVRPGRLVKTIRYQYPDRQVTIFFLQAALLKGTPQALAHHRLAWVSPKEFEHYAFCPANQEILELLKQKDRENAEN